MSLLSQQIKTDSSASAVVDQDYYWLPIDSNTPRACKLQLINKQAGVAMYGVLGYNNEDEKFWTHWCPLPKFKEVE